MRWLVLVVCVIACSDPPPPVHIEDGLVMVMIWPEPARITVYFDNIEVWSTREGGGSGKPPNGFAAIGAQTSTVEMQFGSFRFTEDETKESWRSIGKLGPVEVSGRQATFTLLSGDSEVGTGTVFIDGGHVGIQLAVPQTDSRLAINAVSPKDEHLVGLGGQSFDIDHRGERVPLWVQEDGIGKFPDPDDKYLGVWFLTGRKHSTHTPMPMLLSSRGYALAVDTYGRAIFDLAKTHDDTAVYEVWDKTLQLHLFLGEGSAEETFVANALSQMIAWVGKPPRPPELIFAPWVDALFGSTNVRRVAQSLRANGVSSSVIWTEDWRGGNDGSTGYALKENWRVDRSLYPDFEAVSSELRGMGFAWHTYHNTFIDSTADVYTEATSNGYAIKDESGAPFMFTGVKFNQSTLLDLSNPAAVTWAKSVMTEALALGSDGWMADFAEWLPTDAHLASSEDALAVHNRYTVDWARMNEEMFASPPAGRPPPIYFMRSAWLHSQPHVQVMWAGDQQTDWSEGDGFPSVVPIGLGLGLAGFPYFGHDIGGYMDQTTTTTSEELFFRWTTLGAMSPVMRTHHGRAVHDNVQWETNTATIAHFARWARFHMQLAAYLSGSTASFEQLGLPLFRMIALEFPYEDWTWTTVDEYMLGDRILVAPIVAEGQTTRTVRLPPGAWFPLFGGPPIQGGEIIAVAAPDTIPAYVPAGTLLVLYPAAVDTMLGAPSLASATTLAETNESREIWVYPGLPTKPSYAAWHDTTGPLGDVQYSRGSNDVHTPAPTWATYNGVGVPVTVTANQARVTVTGDGGLTTDTGESVLISRGFPNATYTIVMHY